MIHKFFFTSQSATNLGISRLLFYLWYMFQLYAYKPIEYSALPNDYWDPVLLVRFFDAPTPEKMTCIVILLSICAFCACVGFFTRISTALTAVLGIYVFGCMESYGRITFHFSPMIIISCILPFSRCADAWSFDSLFGNKTSANSSDYCWPIKLCQIAFISLIFTAGFQKISGNWLVQPIHNMECWLAYKFYLHAKFKGHVLPQFTLTVVQCKPLLLLMAITMIVGECCSPLALIEKKPLLRFFLIGTLFTMQLLLALWLKTIPAFPWLAAYFFFVPWKQCGRQLFWYRRT